MKWKFISDPIYIYSSVHLVRYFAISERMHAWQIYGKAVTSITISVSPGKPSSALYCKLHLRYSLNAHPLYIYDTYAFCWLKSVKQLHVILQTCVIYMLYLQTILLLLQWSRSITIYNDHSPQVILLQQCDVIIVLYIWRNTLISETRYGMGEFVNKVKRTLYNSKHINLIYTKINSLFLLKTFQIV